VLPVIRGLRDQTAVPISIDTVKAEVAEAAIEAGAAIVNDVSGFHRDPRMLGVIAESGAGSVAMHMRGVPSTMQQFTDYRDLIGDICLYFREILDRAGSAGLDAERLIIDPGIGFSKTAEQNLDLIVQVAHFRELGRPVLLGPSRKSFIGQLLPGTVPKGRQWGTAAAVACGVLLGADIVRVHDVAEMRQVSVVAAALRRAWTAPEAVRVEPSGTELDSGPPGPTDASPGRCFDDRDSPGSVGSAPDSRQR
jgi:dihydropteroate synthase